MIAHSHINKESREKHPTFVDFIQENKSKSNQTMTNSKQITTVQNL